MIKSENARTIITLAIIVIFAGAVGFTFVNAALPNVLGEDGTTVISSPFANSKDVLAVVAAALTLVLGYWFGSAQSAKSDKVAEESKAAVAVLSEDVSAEKVKSAKERHPLAF
jgi:hypothetical protein